MFRLRKGFMAWHYSCVPILVSPRGTSYMPLVAFRVRVKSRVQGGLSVTVSFVTLMVSSLGNRFHPRSNLPLLPSSSSSSLLSSLKPPSRSLLSLPSSSPSRPPPGPFSSLSMSRNPSSNSSSPSSEPPDEVLWRRYGKKEATRSVREEGRRSVKERANERCVVR